MKFKHEIKNKTAVKVGLIITAIWLTVIGIMVFVYLQNPERNILYVDTTVYREVTVPIRDIKKGEIFSTENIKRIKINENDVSLSEENIPLYEEVIGKKSLNDLLKGEFIYKKDTYEISFYDGLMPVAINIDMFATVANKIKIGDIIDLNITYGHLGEVYSVVGENETVSHYQVIAKNKIVEDLRTGEGKTISNDMVPKYLIIYLTPTELNNYLYMYGKGNIFLRLYEDIKE